MKTPLMREVREVVRKAKADGAFFVVFYNKNGKREMSCFRPISRMEAKVLLKWITPPTLANAAKENA